MTIDSSAIQDGIRQLMQAGTIQSVALIGFKNDTEDEIYFGEANADSLFEIGSTTKPITATLLAVLEAESRLSLGDPLSKFVAQELAWASQVSIADLMAHTAGVPRLPPNIRTVDFNPRDPYAHYNETMLRSSLAEVALVETGKIEYSNYGYAILGLVASEVTQTSFETAVGRAVFQPLGMQTVCFAEKLSGNVLTGHAATGEPTEHWHQTAMTPAGGAVANLGDLTTFVRATLDPPAQLRAAIQRLRSGHRTSEEQIVGLGWHHADMGSTPILWSNGGTGGFGAFMVCCPSLGSGLVCLYNSEPSRDLEKLLRGWFRQISTT